jgi:hypothetical protein
MPVIKVDTGVRASLGIVQRFLKVLTRIDGTAKVPNTKKKIGFFGNTMIPATPVTYITGTITEDGSPAAKRLRLYDQETGHLVAETFSNVSGVYTFNDVSTSNAYYIVAFDEDGSPMKNAQVLDKIQK